MARRKPTTDPMSIAGNDGQSLTNTDALVFGNIGSSGREVMKDILIDKIWPDLRQPRRAIPLAVRGKWDGNPDAVGMILQQWALMASEEMDEELAIGVLLESTLDGEETYTITPDKFPITHSLMELISLSASILQHGMVNPISIVERGKHYLIETGERRWLAHHLLRVTVQADEWKKIKTRVVDGNVWLQAAENGSRSPLNAISMARQLALLIMDMYADEQVFDDYENLVAPGECDQPYYAQAADLRIRRGYGQRVLDVTGLKSKNQISQYRALLSIPELLWMQADVENWTENRIRETDQERRGVRGNNVLSTLDDEIEGGYTLTTVNLSDDSETESQAPNITPDDVSSGDISPVSAWRDESKMAQPTGYVPDVDPTKALGRDRGLRFTPEIAMEMNSMMLHNMLDTPSTYYNYTNQTEVEDILKAEIHRRREKMGLKDDPAPDTTQEPIERALESDTPLIAEWNFAKQLMLQIAYCAQGQEIRVDGVRLDKLINDIQTASLEDIRIMIANADSEDIGWFKDYLDTAFVAIGDFVQDELEPFFKHLWNEAQRMRVKYPIEVEA